MAIYVVEPDTYAGWSGAGRYFALFGLAAGAIALGCWAATHRPVYGAMLADPSDQLFLSALVWIGGGVFVIMAIGVLGSLILSDKASGTVVVDDIGVTRQVGNRTRILRWEEIEGFVATPYGGVTLIPRKGGRRIEIPRFLDDYRGCIAEIKSMHIGALPSGRLRNKRSWWQVLQVYVAILLFEFARDAGMRHRERAGSFWVCLASFCVCVALVFWFAVADWKSEGSRWLRWATVSIALALLVWLVLQMARTW